MSDFGPSEEFAGEDWVLAPPTNANVGIVPPFGSHPVEYCRRRGGNLLIEFRNTGELEAPPENVTVCFIFDDQSNVTRTRLRAPIAPNDSVVTEFAIPDGWFRGGGSDPGFVVTWSNQPPVYGRCIS